VISVQPRIRLQRSFDQRSHSYLGYVLRMRGEVGEEHRNFTVGIGKGAHAKHSFRAGDEVSGEACPVADAQLEPAEFYRASKLKLQSRGPEATGAPPPWHGVPPELSVYRQRGHRRLSAKTYDSRCWECIWGCRMPVEMIIDQWKPHLRRYRYETFCYGPLPCAWYAAGQRRIVPGRKGMKWEEPDWVDEEATRHRLADE
jgi:hypothetical protein